MARLRREGLPIAIEFVGDAYPQAQAASDRTMRRLDPHGQFLNSDRQPSTRTCRPVTTRPTRSSSPRAVRTCRTFCWRRWRPVCRLPVRVADRCPRSWATGALYFDPLQPETIADALRRLVDACRSSRPARRRALCSCREFSWAVRRRRLNSWPKSCDHRMRHSIDEGKECDARSAA